MDKKKIKFVCISDSHTQAKDVELPEGEGDVLIHAGDFTKTGQPKEVSDFNDFLRNSKFEVKIVIAGNHEISFDEQNYSTLKKQHYYHMNENFDVKEIKSLLKDCIYLEDQSYILQGIHIYGSPYTPKLHRWGFGLEGEEQSIQKWKQIPTQTDILITHGGPFKIMDADASEPSLHYGDETLREEVLNRVKPKYHIFGHVHGAYGTQKINETTFINCSILDEHYFLSPEIQKPICFEYEV